VEFSLLPLNSMRPIPYPTPAPNCQVAFAFKLIEIRVAVQSTDLINTLFRDISLKISFLFLKDIFSMSSCFYKIFKEI
jgi:hypothetical protein